MSGNNITINLNVSDNPWLPSYESFSFKRELIEDIASEYVEVCSGKDHYKSSYEYDSDIDRVSRKHSDFGSLRPLYAAVNRVIGERIKEECLRGWHDGHVAAFRTIECKLAYMSPGFIEAKRYQALYS
jgi:hypothetical protein